MFGVILYLYINNVFGCDKEFNFESKGRIDTYDQVAKVGGICTYTIRTPSSTRVKLTWEKFDVDGIMPKCNNKDYVRVYIGCSRVRKVGEFCSSNMKSLPHDIYSPDSCMQIYYSKSSEFGGFEATFSSYSTNQPLSERCDMKTYITKLPVTISSPGWPYKVYSHSCEWDIDLGDYMQEIVVNIMDLNGFSYSSYDCYYNKGSVNIKGIKASSSSSGYQNSWHYCEDREDRNRYFTTTTIVEYHEMSINFHNNLQFDNRGFVLGMVAYKKVDEDSTMSVSVVVTSFIPIIIVVVAVVAVLIIIVCIVRRCRNRSSQRQQGQPMQSQPMVATDTAMQPTQGYPMQTYVAPGTAMHPTLGYPIQTYAAPSAPEQSPYPAQNLQPYQQPSPYDKPKGAASTPYPSYPPPGPIPPQEYPTNDQHAPPSYDVLYPTK